ncbi:MAG: glycosyltransferase [Candidatus Heimdallarchaeota archaeon]
MTVSAYKNVLLTSNIRLTDTDGKSHRVIKLAGLFNALGFHVVIMVGKCTSATVKRHYSVIETKTDPKDTSLDNLLKKVVRHIRQLVTLLSVYMKILVYGMKYNIITSSSVSPPIDSLLAYMLSKFTKVPFIYDYDDPSPQLIALFNRCSINDPQVKLSLISERMLIRNASLVLTSSETLRDHIARDFGKIRRVYVYHNLPKIRDINICEDKYRLRRKLGLNVKSFLISYLGNPQPYVRGIETLVNCAVDFKDNEAVLFLIIGGGQWEEYYRTLVKRLDLVDRVSITGKKPRQNALEYLAASDVSCIPYGVNPASVYHAPTKLFEAMALRVPLLCTRLPNFVGILGNNGIYFDGSHEDLTRKIRWCMVNLEQLDKTGSSLRSRFLRRFTWEKQHLHSKNVLRALLKLGNSSR